MKPDLLREATQALRQQTHGESDRAAETRRQMLASLSNPLLSENLRGVRRASKLRRLPWMLPIAAVLVASSAWATSQGNGSDAFRWALETIEPTPPARMAPAIAHRGQALSGSAQGAAPAAESRAVSPMGSSAAPPERGSFTNGPSVAPCVEPSALVVASVAPPPAAPSAAPARRTRSTTGASSMTKPIIAATGPVVTGKEPVDEGEDPKVQALYAAAHQKHFGGHNPAGALQAWDAYLQAAPSGRFATEARYNRALCLARLGQSADATSALSSFANAPAGTYRQGEARALVEALSALGRQGIADSAP